MDKINPLLYITDTDPVPETVLDASGWFETEYMDMGAGDQAAQYLEWYMAQGWTLLPSTSVVSNPPPVWFWQYRKAGIIPLYIPTFEQIGWSSYTFNDDQILPSHGHYIPSASSTAITYHLKRRKLQSERVLNDMLREFTEAYNEGRSINDQRYDEIVTIYNVMLDKSQDELATLSTSSTSYNSLITTIISQLGTDFTAYQAEVAGLLTGYGASRIAEVNLRFDNELAKARASLVDRGMNNTTVSVAISAGIEAERQKALTDLQDKIVETKLASAGKVNEARDSMRKGMLAAHERLSATLRDHALTPLNFRNQILTAMLAFMERRTDEYPGLESLTGIAAQLGYSEGASVVAP